MRRFPPLRSYVIGSNHAINRIMVDAGFKLAEGMKDAEIVVFQGGADVSPYFYGEMRHPQTHCDEPRDKFEFACYKATMGKFRVGICRGAQFLNVMNGGFLYQHVDGHCNGAHTIRYIKADVARHIISYHRNITSTHHQMMAPHSKTAHIWAQASESTKKETGVITNGQRRVFNFTGDHQSDVEICYYPNTRSLCFQPHPEYNSKETRDLFFDCIERALAE